MTSKEVDEMKVSGDVATGESPDTAVQDVVVETISTMINKSGGDSMSTLAKIRQGVLDYVDGPTTATNAHVEL